MGLFSYLDSLYSFFKGFTLFKALQGLSFRLKGSPDGYPFPPSSLIHLIIGVRWKADYWESGKRLKHMMEIILESHGIILGELRDILDFGCGCGRIIRHFKDLKEANLYGTDYNLRLVEWCRQNLSFARFNVNQLKPPLPYKNESFDLVYARSVFTHLPEKLQVNWMTEIYRILKPGGVILLTTHGYQYQDALDQNEKVLFNRGELIVHYAERAGENICAALHPYEYVRDVLAEKFELLDFIPGKAGPYSEQDTYLLKK